jgi:DNA processing protein
MELNEKNLLITSLSWLSVKLTVNEALMLLSKTPRQAFSLILGGADSALLDVTIKNHLHELRRAQAEGVQFLPFYDPLYPPEFKMLEHPPLLLSFYGDPRALLVRPRLAVVGSRNASHQSLLWLDKELGNAIKDIEPVIISGGARGVDQKSHVVAVRKKARTLCFLPSGILHFYPADLINYKDWIVSEGGAFISPFAPLSGMRKHYFHIRNELMALLSNYVLVVQARQRSGTIVTAKYALHWGKRVGVVPDFPDVATLGGLDLLYDGADLIRSSQDLVFFIKDNLRSHAQAPQPMNTEGQEADNWAPNGNISG